MSDRIHVTVKEMIQWHLFQKYPYLMWGRVLLRILHFYFVRLGSKGIEPIYQGQRGADR